jgi:hypothetical protein
MEVLVVDGSDQYDIFRTGSMASSRDVCWFVERKGKDSMILKKVKR